MVHPYHPSYVGQETEHVETELVKTDEHTFVWMFVNTVEFAASGSLHGDPVKRLTQKASTFMGISVHIVVCTAVCIFMEEFVGQISHFACSALV